MFESVLPRTVHPDWWTIRLLSIVSNAEGVLGTSQRQKSTSLVLTSEANNHPCFAPVSTDSSFESSAAWWLCRRTWERRSTLHYTLGYQLREEPRGSDHGTCQVRTSRSNSQVRYQFFKLYDQYINTGIGWFLKRKTKKKPSIESSKCNLWKGLKLKNRERS